MDDRHDPADSFAEILERARKGDRAARDALFARMADEKAEGAALLAMARRMLPAEDRMRGFLESRDLLQSALCSGWVDLSAFRGETRQELLGWIRGIVRRKLMQGVRKRYGRDGNREELDRQVERDEDDEPFVAVMRAEVRQRVGRAVERLPPDQRKVMELRLAGRRAKEIAAMLDLTPEAVRKRESRAAGRLRELLKG